MTQENGSVAEGQGSGEGQGGKKPVPRIHSFLKTVAAVNGSDLHLKADAVPRIRVGGELKALKTEALSNDDILAMVEEILQPEQLAELQHRGSVDLAYAMTRVDRFRMNIF